MTSVFILMIEPGDDISSEDIADALEGVYSTFEKAMEKAKELVNEQVRNFKECGLEYTLETLENGIFLGATFYHVFEEKIDE